MNNRSIVYYFLSLRGRFDRGNLKIIFTKRRDCGVYPEQKPRLLRIQLAMTARDLLAMTII